MESLETCLKFQEELSVLLFGGSNLKRDDVSLFNFISNLENPRDVLDFGIKFKNEGNSSFREGDFDEALEKYSLSCVFLSCLVLGDEGVRSSFLQEASSIVLNMAASLLKKKEYEQVGHLCSIALNYDPNNLKALFRRAKAAMGLGKLKLASWDLRMALDVEPTNKETLRMLREVEESIHTSSRKNQGKRKAKQLECESKEPAFDNSEMTVDFKSTKSKNFNCSSKDQGDNMASERLEVNEVNPSRAIGPEEVFKRVKVGVDHKLESSATQDELMNERVENNGFRGKESESSMDEEKVNLHFRHKNKPGATIGISKKEYLILSKGRMVQHYNPRSGVIMSIRAVGVPQGTKKTQTQPSTHSSSVHHDEVNYRKLSANSDILTLTDQATETAFTEFPSLDPVEVKTQTKDTPMLLNNPSHTSSPQQISPFLQISTTGNCSFPFQSITTGNRSPLRRANYQTSNQGVKKRIRVNSRKHSCVFSNLVFYRCKVATTVLLGDHHPPNSQELTSSRIGMKRKSAFVQIPDVLVQPRKFVILNYACNSFSNGVRSTSSGCKSTFVVINEKLAKTSATG